MKEKISNGSDEEGKWTFISQYKSKTLMNLLRGETSEWEPKFSAQDFIRMLQKKTFKAQQLVGDFLQFLVREI